MVSLVMTVVRWQLHKTFWLTCFFSRFNCCNSFLIRNSFSRSIFLLDSFSHINFTLNSDFSIEWQEVMFWHVKSPFFSLRSSSVFRFFVLFSGIFPWFCFFFSFLSDFLEFSLNSLIQVTFDSEIFKLPFFMLLNFGINCSFVFFKSLVNNFFNCCLFFLLKLLRGLLFLF